MENEHNRPPKPGLQSREPWTPEEARAFGSKGGKAKRVYTLRGALARRLKFRDPNGKRTWDKVLEAFVTKLEQGDVRAIELAMESVDGPQVVKRETTKTSRLIVQPASTPELPRVVEAAPIQPDTTTCSGPAF